MFEPYEIKLDEPQIIPTLDNCFLIVDTIEILPMSNFVNYYGKEYELYEGELIEKEGRKIMQLVQEVNVIDDAE